MKDESNLIIYIRRDDNPSTYIDEFGDEQEGEYGWLYDIYTSQEDYDNAESIDGGLCTGSRDDALKMALTQIHN